MQRAPIGLYVHIPFCRSICTYCDFNTYAGIDTLAPKMAEALCAEIWAWGELMQHAEIGTVFVGGGTPSYIAEEFLSKIWHTIRTVFRENSAESTIEVNPEDVTPAKAAAWRTMGFDRVSLGVQSADAAILKAMQRRHTRADLARAVSELREAGFANISADLIYGWPGETLDGWRDTLEHVLTLETEHVSAYALQVEPTTLLSSQIKSRELAPPDDDLAAEKYFLADDILAANGFKNYEISNWAQAGRESRHNLTYWSLKPYIGVGAGAHSYLPPHRFANVKPPKAYIDAAVKFEHNTRGKTLAEIFKQPLIASSEELNAASREYEFIILQLRLSGGLSLGEFKARFGADFKERYGADVKELSAVGLLMVEEGRVKLTRRGRMVSNEVFVRFVADAE